MTASSAIEQRSPRAQSELVPPRRLGKKLGGVLADRLQHPVAAVGEAQEALLDQRLERVEVGVTDLLGGLERAAAREDGQAGEELLLLV